MATHRKNPLTWSENGRRFFAVVVATALYSGYAPLASGTVGTLFALPVVWLWSGLPAWLQVSVCLGVFAAGLWACRVTTSVFKKKDPSQIVIDEVVGFLIAMVAVPVSLYWVLWAFLLFRFFDIVKPFPISWIDQKVKGSWGVMLDDVVAGIFTNALLQLMMRASLTRVA